MMDPAEDRYRCDAAELLGSPKIWSILIQREMSSDLVVIRSISLQDTAQTVSLANREIGRVLPTNYRNVSFSGAVDHLNKAATARYFGQLSRESLETRDSLAVRDEFEPSYMDPAPVASRSID